MARAKFLPPLPSCRGSCLKSCTSKKDTRTTAPPTASNETEMNNSQVEVSDLLSNFTETESESDRELSFSFFINNASTENETDIKKEGAALKGKNRRRHSRSSSDGVLLNIHVPVPFPESHIMPHSGHETPGTTLAELKKREMELEKLGCLSALLLRKKDHTRQTDDISQFKY